jgi:hypothetical protein
MIRIRGFFFVGLAILYPWLVIGPAGIYIQATWARLLVFCILALLGAALVKLMRPGFTTLNALALAVLVYGAIYKIASFAPEISSYPFSLGWSEASRYYYASTFLPEKIYGAWTPPSVLHPSRYLMQAVPFLVQDMPLWVHRAWQVFLWISTSLVTGILLGKRLGLQPGLYRILFTCWAFLFLFQGPLYYHLLVMVILVLWGFDRQHFWRSLVVVLLASAWAGISRINWLPAPGLLAAALYFLEAKVEGQGWLKYLLKPAAWVSLGTPLAYVVQVLYEQYSGNLAEYFGSSFSSDLLWYRLLPNATYPLGVLPAAILVSLPLILLIFSRLVVRSAAQDSLAGWRLLLHPIRLLGLAAILFVLGGGGIVVSVKIGGGSNLHNIDAFLVLLMVTGSYVAFGRFSRDEANLRNDQSRPTPVLVALVIALPVLFAITAGGPLPGRNQAAEAAALSELQESVSQVTADGGEVLFIAERHLLIFNNLDAGPVVHKYEKVFLMEMAMAGNPSYFEDFYEDLYNHRFGLIISNPLWPHYQGRTHSFGEENDAWVRWVVEPLTCAYKEWKTLPEIPLVLLVPNKAMEACP